ncbi:hypothetical protein BDN67DRAFT_932857 [Paxillus ammoniavirescens]|nr:hypothetical protein BDN67DRAFT_932857 [Paxillus ammoniavirescens]
MFKSAATKIAHNTTIPALAGNSDLRPLQDLITAEKTVLVSLQRLSVDLSKSSEALRVWGQGEGDDLGDILTASTAVLAHFTAALSTYASLHHTMRDNMKAVRTHEEALDELRRRRRRVGASAESAEKKLNRMGPEHKNLGAQTEILNKLREEMRTMDGDIVRDEAGLSDFKRKCAKNWMTLKLGGLVECCEKGAIVGDMGKHIVQFIPEDVTQPGLPRAYYNAHSRVGDLVVETQRAVSQVAFSGSPSGRAYGSAAGNVNSQTSAPPNQQAQGSLDISYLPTPSLGSELTLNVNAYNAQSVAQPPNRRPSADELGVQFSQVNNATQSSSLPTRERNPAPATDSARPLSLSARLGDGTGRTDEDQSLMASIADALSQSHRGMTLEEAISLGHTHDEPAPKYEPFAPTVQSEIHGPNGHAPTPAEGPLPRRNVRRSTSPPSLPPGAAPAAVRAWDDGMGQGEDGAHSDRPASSSQRMPSQRRITSSEPDGEEEVGLAYDRDDRSEDEATEHANNNINSGGEGSLSESGKEDGASVRNLIDTKQSSPATDTMQRPNSTSAPVQASSSATMSVNNAASTSPSMEPPLRAESQRRIPRVPPPSVDTNVDMPNRPASPHGGPKSGTISDDDAQTDESVDERARNAAAAREVSRELDALAFSANSPTTGSNYVPPLGPPLPRGPSGYAPQGHPTYQPQLPIIQTPSPRSRLPYDSNPPSPLAPPNAPFASRSVSPHLQAIPTRGRSPPSPSLDGRPFPPNSSFGPHGVSPLQAGSSPRPSHLDVIPGRSDSSGSKTPTHRTPPEYPRHTPPFSSPLMAKSTSSLGGGGAPGGAPRTISAAAFRRQQARSPSGTGNELGPADTSPLALRRPSPVPAPPPKGPTRRLSVINPDPPTTDDEDFDYIGAYGGGDDEGGGKRQSGGYGSGKYVSDLEKR